MANYFIFLSSYPPFNASRDESFLKMMYSVAGENDLKSLKIPQLKMCLNDEHNLLNKETRQEVLDHYEDANENSFCQFAHYSATLLKKDKYQAFGIHFADTKFRHNDAITLSFRKPFSHESYKVAALVEEACNECFELDFTHIFLLLHKI